MTDEHSQWEPPATPDAEVEGNLVKMLATFAAWHPCRSCGIRVLYVDDNIRTDTPFVCGRCESRAEKAFSSTAAIARTSGVTADHGVDGQMRLEAKPRRSFVTSAPRAIDAECLG